MWEDIGPASQGKILTAILQGREDDAERMLRHWPRNDLAVLFAAAWKLEILVRKVSAE